MTDRGPSNSSSPPRPSRRNAVGAIGAIGLLAAAGSRAAAQAPAPLKIGFISDMSGIVVDLSGPGSLTATRMAVEDYGGKVLGRPIEIISGDHQNKPDIGITMARRWYDEGVRAIFDVGVTTVALGIQTLAKEKDRIVIFNSSASADLTGSACSPNGIHWTYDNYAQSQGSIRQLNAAGAKTWFFLTIDYAYGRNVQRDATAMIEKAGGRVIGAVNHPWEMTDYSSHLLQAQRSKADVIALATTTGHAGNALKQAEEFGIQQAGQKIAALSFTLHDVKALGLKSAQNLLVTESYYWDQGEEERAFANRYKQRFGRMPNYIQASLWGSVTHYLKAVDKAGTDDTAKVMAAMREMPINDFMTKNGSIRADGRVMRNMYVFRVKTPAESKHEWDLYEQVTTIPPNEAFAPADPKVCPLVKA